VEVLRLLGDHTRLATLAMLDGTDMSVTQIAQALDRPAPGVPQYLGQLRAGRLVKCRRDSTTVYYTQPDAHVAALVTNVQQHFEHVLYADQPPTRADQAGINQQATLARGGRR